MNSMFNVIDNLNIIVNITIASMNVIISNDPGAGPTRTETLHGKLGVLRLLLTS